MVSAVLEMKHIAKSFSGNKVLLDVDLTVEEGEVHALLGENGAGKSTLMKILGGIYTKDAGSILINGREVQIHNVADARDNGISIIHQELMLARHMTIAENVFMGREQKRAGGFVDLARQEAETQRFLDHYGIKLKADTRLDRLTIAQQQMVEIIRAVSFGSRIIVMDEPTSSLSDAEVDILYEMIRILKEQKVSIIYISHRLNELYDIADRTTVLRDGEHVGTVRMKETERAELIAMMVGRDLASYYTKNDNAKDEVVLEVKELSDGKMVKKVSFDLRKGEILGVSGLVGAGRSETVECLFGIRRKVRGTVRFKGREVDFKNPREAMASGFGMVPESRKEQGLFLQSGVRFNTTINVVPRFLKHFIWNRQAEDGIVEGKINDMHIRVTGPEQVVGKLSGGNQQKVLIGRWLCSTQSVLILDEPTRGVDVGAKAMIHEILRRLADSGMAVWMISSELPEILGVSDKVIVMHEGKCQAVLENDNLTEEIVMKAAFREEVEGNG